MFGFFAKKLTEYSHHYIDFSRSAEILLSGNHRYSTDELLVRGKIAAFTAVSAFLGAYFNDKEKTNCSTLTVSVAAGFLGLTLAHTYYLIPLIKKRYEMSKECDRLILDINSKIEKIESESNGRVDQKEFDTWKNAVESVVQHIQNLSLSGDKHARASQTWGRRKNLLSKVSHQLNEYDPDFWQGEVSSIMEKLTQNAIQCEGPRLR